MERLKSRGRSSRLISRIGKASVVLIACLAAIPKPPLREGLSFSQAVFDRGGRLLRLTTAADERFRMWQPLSSFSPELIEATLLHEDRHFKYHPGFNPVSLVRAAWHTYVGGGRRIGGSTLTMQLARIRYRMKSRTLRGKLVQLARAVQLERHYSKKEILEAYLNLAPYGENVEGAAAASLIYFGKAANRLTLQEILTLAVIPQSPTRRALGTSRGAAPINVDLSAARNALFERWIADHPGDLEQRQMMALPIKVGSRSALPFLAPHFTDDLLQEDRDLTGSIPSTLDLDLQKTVERLVATYVESRRMQGVHNAAVLLADHRTMDVLAAVGSADYFDESIQGQVNGFRAKRSPGSLLKPFAYALGFDQGVVHPMTMLKDTPSRFSGFSPENFDRDFSGPVAARDALIRSRNVPAVEIASRLREPNFYGFLRHVNIDLPRGPDYYGLAPVLGGAEVTMENLVQLYASLANRGEIRGVRTRMDRDAPGGDPLFTPESSFMVLEVLKDVVRPNQGYRPEWTGNIAPVYWKTGTSSAFRDAWSVGIFGQYVLAVWLGNFNGEGNPSFIGIQTAAPLFFGIIDALQPHAENLYLTGPARLGRLSKVRVCAVSGRIPNPHCPHTVDTWFIPGRSPIERCDIHRLVPIDSTTGRRACLDRASRVKPSIFEFWPSDLLDLFRRAGIPRRTPPPDNPRCPIDINDNRGVPPVISSPETGVAYTMRMTAIEKPSIPLAAVADADVRRLYWFDGDRYVDKANNGETLYWVPRQGKSVLRVIDDHGRADAVTIEVVLTQ